MPLKKTPTDSQSKETQQLQPLPTKSGLFKEFGYSLEKSVHGVWHELDKPNDDGTKPRLLIARQHHRNKAWYERWHDLSQKYPDATKGLTGEGDYNQLQSAYEYLAKLYPNTVLLDWEHVQDDDGNDFPFKTEIVEKILRTFPEFTEHVTLLSTQSEHYRMTMRMDIAKELVTL